MELWQMAKDTGLVTVLIVAMLTLLVTAVKYGSAWLQAKTDQIKNEKVRNALKQVEAAAETAVIQTAQMEADALKAAADNGKLTAEDAQRMKQLAIDRAKLFLQQDVIETAKKGVQDFDAWLEGLVEREVRLLNGGTK